MIFDYYYYCNKSCAVSCVNMYIHVRNLKSCFSFVSVVLPLGKSMGNSQGLFSPAIVISIHYHNMAIPGKCALMCVCVCVCVVRVYYTPTIALNCACA